MKKTLILIPFLLVSCVANVASKQEIIKPEDLKQKECYSYRIHKNEMQKAVGWGVVGGLLGPLGPLIAVSAMAAQEASLPTKCGLTVEDAVKEAYVMAFYENSMTTLTEKGKDTYFRIIAKPIIRNDRCLLCNLKIVKSIPEEKFRQYELNMEICKDDKGEPTISKENCTEQEFSTLKVQYEQEIEQKQKSQEQSQDTLK